MLETLDAVLREDKVTLKDLRTIVGKLIWASSVASLGLVYASKALRQIKGMKEERASLIVDLSLPRFKKTRDTLVWFAELLVQWCGIAVYTETAWQYASTVHGCSSDSSPIGGAFTTPDSYSFWVWCTCGCADTTNIMRLELASILIGLSTRMAPLFSGRLVSWLCDSLSGVSCFNKGYAQDEMSRTQVLL
jgi:hypothetical protein